MSDIDKEKFDNFCKEVISTLGATRSHLTNSDKDFKTTNAIGDFGFTEDNLSKVMTLTMGDLQKTIIKFIDKIFIRSSEKCSISENELIDFIIYSLNSREVTHE